jgi:hypothetical protein
LHIAYIEEPKDDAFATLLAFEQGQNFVLVVQRGTHLSVCELPINNPEKLKAEEHDFITT